MDSKDLSVIEISLTRILHYAMKSEGQVAEEKLRFIIQETRTLRDFVSRIQPAVFESTTQAKHQQTAWRAVKAEGSSIYFDILTVDGDREIVGDCGVIGEENAHLIAAAPDLFAALEEIISRNEIQHWFNLDQARRAVAKAKNEGC